MLFRNEYFFLSNMYPSKISIPIVIPGDKPHYETLTFSCVEAAFQAMKDPSRIKEFVKLDGYNAKKLGRTVKLRDDWNNIKNDIMKMLVRLKFEQNPDIYTKLLNVSGTICEDNTWHDTYWGKCNGVGENHLGKILMKIRDDGQIVTIAICDNLNLV